MQNVLTGRKWELQQPLILGSMDRLLVTLRALDPPLTATLGTEIEREVIRRARNLLAEAATHLIYDDLLDDRMAIKAVKTLLGLRFEISRGKRFE